MTDATSMIDPAKLSGKLIESVNPGKFIYSFEHACFMVTGIGANTNDTVAVFLSGDYQFHGPATRSQTWSVMEIGAVRLQVDFSKPLQKAASKTGHIRVRNGNVFLFADIERGAPFSVVIADKYEDRSAELRDDVTLFFEHWQLVMDGENGKPVVVYERAPDAATPVIV